LGRCQNVRELQAEKLASKSTMAGLLSLKKAKTEDEDAHDTGTPFIE
jgi:hypothetical protein